jgi:hypothetical protein
MALHYVPNADTDGGIDEKVDKYQQQQQKRSRINIK